MGGGGLCRLTLHPAAAPGGCFFRLPQELAGGCDLCPVTGSTATPVHGCFLGVGSPCFPGAAGAWGGAWACSAARVPGTRSPGDAGARPAPRRPLTSPPCPPGSGENDSTEKVVEKLEALSVQEGEQPQDAAPAAVEEEQ